MGGKGSRCEIVDLGLSAVLRIPYEFYNVKYM